MQKIGFAVEVIDILDNLAEIEVKNKAFYVNGEKITACSLKEETGDLAFFSYVNNEEKIDLVRTSYDNDEINKNYKVKYEIYKNGDLKKKVTKVFENGKLKEQIFGAEELGYYDFYIDENGSLEKIASEDFVTYKSTEGKLLSRDKKDGKKVYFIGEDCFIIDSNGNVLSQEEFIKSKKAFNAEFLKEYELLKKKLTITEEIKGIDDKFIKNLNAALVEFIELQRQKVLDYDSNDQTGNLINYLARTKNFFEEFDDVKLLEHGDDIYVDRLRDDVRCFVNDIKYQREIAELSNIKVENLTESQKVYVLKKLGVYDNLYDDCK